MAARSIIQLLILSVVPMLGVCALGAEPFRFGRSSITPAGGTHAPVLAGDGRSLFFLATAAGRPLGPLQVWHRSLPDGPLTLVTTNAAGQAADGHSPDLAVSADGRFIALATEAANLVADDTNGRVDLFLRALRLGRTMALTLDLPGLGLLVRVASDGAWSADSRSFAFEAWDEAGAGRGVFVAQEAEPDADDDGLDDDWEVANFGSLARDGSDDFDADGLDERTEFDAATNPKDPASGLRVHSAGVPDGETLRFSYATVAGMTYQVESAPEVTGPWWPAGPVVRAGGTIGEFGLPADGPRAFARVVPVPIH
ncbi:MAG: hypothetical protein ACKVYV_01085 [Limisphaerales bacterium]